MLAPLAHRDVFYVTHKSTYDIRSAKLNGDLAGGDATQQSVFDSLTPGAVPTQVRLLILGHDHQFQVVDFQGADYAPQLVVGNSGTLLDGNDGNQPQAFVPDATGTNAGAAYALSGVAGTPTIAVRATADRSEYGFTVLGATGGGYVAQVHEPDIQHARPLRHHAQPALDALRAVAARGAASRVERAASAAGIVRDGGARRSGASLLAGRRRHASPGPPARWRLRRRPVAARRVGRDAAWRRGPFQQADRRGGRRGLARIGGAAGDVGHCVGAVARRRGHPAGARPLGAFAAPAPIWACLGRSAGPPGGNWASCTPWLSGA